MSSTTPPGQAQYRSKGTDDVALLLRKDLGLNCAVEPSRVMRVTQESCLNASISDSECSQKNAPLKPSIPEIWSTKAENTANPTHEAKAPRYIKLRSEYTDSLSWTNDPRDLDLDGAFNELKPNLSNDFNVPGLRPILKDKYGDEMWILRDDAGVYYLWNMWEGHLARVTDKWTKGSELVSTEDIVDNILSNLSWVEDDAVTVFKD
ncbi:hypothetical protein BDU57DRAFT_523808 [Ampelomyces quisqualis]|uniref:Uncharacterized protein n=1 Tax=Ampelomyces quisqualis TaxID=50730 RepID=A0A6A5Q7R5_AMPQU|nr:hypothetical protein BDU57DRAFT_523808 [Ampelomyces quisqualis]